MLFLIVTSVFLRFFVPRHRPFRQEEMRAYDAASRRELTALDREIELAREALTRALNENSAKLADLTDFTQDKRTLERQLDGAQRLVSAGRSAARSRDAEEELNSLRQLANLQQTQMSQLRDQIARLSRKSGHVLPPSKQSVVAPLPPI